MGEDDTSSGEGWEEEREDGGGGRLEDREDPGRSEEGCSREEMEDIEDRKGVEMAGGTWRGEEKEDGGKCNGEETEGRSNGEKDPDRVDASGLSPAPTRAVSRMEDTGGSTGA